MRLGQPSLLALLGLELTGAVSCYRTASVSTKDLRNLGSSIATPRMVATAKGDRVRFDAQTAVRVHMVDGLATGWVRGSDLSVSEEGLLLEAGLRSSDAASASVEGLSAEGVAALTDLAPPLARLDKSKDRWQRERYVLTTSKPGQLLPWVSRFVASRESLGADAGLWRVEAEKPNWFMSGFNHGPARAVSNQELREPLAGNQPVVLARGLRWPQIASLELNYLDPVWSALSVPASVAIFPLLLLFPPDPSDRGEISSGADFGDESPRLVWRQERGTVQPLFHPRAQRRAVAKMLASTAIGGSYRGDLYSSVNVGARFLDFYEVAFVVRELWPKESDPATSWRDALMLGIAMGLHVDGDADPRFAFHAGFEFMGGRGQEQGRAKMFSLVLGPRFGLGHLVFVEVPLELSAAQAPGGLATGFIFASLRVGGAF